MRLKKEKFPKVNNITVIFTCWVSVNIDSVDDYRINYTPVIFLKTLDVQHQNNLVAQRSVLNNK